MDREEVVRWLLETDFFRGLDPRELAELAAAVSVCETAARSVLFRPGDWADDAFVVVSGQFKLGYITPAGREVLVALYPPHKLLGAITALDENPIHFLEAAATEATVSLVIPRQDLLALVDRHPMLLRRLIAELRRHLHREAQAALGDIRSRIASKLLVLLADDSPTRQPALRESVRVSHEHLAGLIAATRSNVSRALGSFESEGVIARQRGGIRVLDMGRLIAIAGELPRA
jgi:CRP-like cAMP-binding protein